MNGRGFSGVMGTTLLIVGLNGIEPSQVSQGGDSQNETPTSGSLFLSEGWLLDPTNRQLSSVRFRVGDTRDLVCKLINGQEVWILPKDAKSPGGDNFVPLTDEQVKFVQQGPNCSPSEKK